MRPALSVAPFQWIRIFFSFYEVINVKAIRANTMLNRREMLALGFNGSANAK